MERQIKFRGKTKKGVWIYGNLFKHKLTHNGKLIDEKFIISDDAYTFCTDNFAYVVEDYSVIKDTIGQLTAWKDFNEKDIYEGDIVKLTVINMFINEAGDFRFSNPYTVICAVEYSSINYRMGFKRISKNSKKCSQNRKWFFLGFNQYEIKNIEIIGNIYDNLEII